VVVLADPPGGVDVGARAELYELIHRATDAGTAVVLASSDFEEVVSEADRALVMVRGRIACELRRGEVTRSRLAAESYALSPCSVAEVTA
jgi:ribose transport system ATP-binding protein